MGKNGNNAKNGSDTKHSSHSSHNSHPDTAPAPATQAREAKRLAVEHGFALSGIALLPESGATPRADGFAKWLDSGFHGPLDYMLHTQATRSRVAERFKWARSVLALGAFYDASPQGEIGKDLSAHVARYARGRDYHLIFEKRLKKLSHALVDAGVCKRSHYYVDTGPVLERAWAERAGLGWIGKNACLIHPKLGSFFLLAEILLDSTPEPDAPVLDHCGTCTRCLDACPTSAFAAPGMLDANKCLVTWNIEMRGETPREFWTQQGEWAAGCDICQTVCPYNGNLAQRRKGAKDAELAEPAPWQTISLADCITMTKEQFDRWFVASALRRTGLKGLRLGAITAAGNVKAESCREALAKCLNDPDAEIRARAEWALGNYFTAVAFS